MTGEDIDELDIADDEKSILEEIIEKEQLSALRRELAFISSDYNGRKMSDEEKIYYRNYMQKTPSDLQEEQNLQTVLTKKVLTSYLSDIPQINFPTRIKQDSPTAKSNFGRYNTKTSSRG